MKFGMWTCYSPAPFMLLLCAYPTPPSSSFCPAPAVLLPCSFQAPIRLIPSSSPSSSPALLYSAQLCSCPVTALLLPCSCFSPALALLQSCSCPAGPAHPSLAAFNIIISTLPLFFGKARAAFYGNWTIGLWYSALHFFTYHLTAVCRAEGETCGAYGNGDDCCAHLELDCVKGT